MTISTIMILYSIQWQRLKPSPAKAEYNRVFGLQDFPIPSVFLKSCL